MQMDASARAQAIVRATRALPDAVLRVAYVLDFLRTSPLAYAAQTLEIVCARAEQAEEAAREALIAIVDALNAEGQAPLVQRLREEDVVRLAAKRPCRPDVLSEIARTPRWAHSPRVRMALVLNPDTPIELATGIVGLLMRQELRLVAETTLVSPGLRAICLEHLERRPPGAHGEDAEGPLH